MKISNYWQLYKSRFESYSIGYVSKSVIIHFFPILLIQVVTIIYLFSKNFDLRFIDQYILTLTKVVVPTFLFFFILEILFTFLKKKKENMKAND